MSSPQETLGAKCASIVRRAMQSSVARVIFASATLFLLIAIVLPLLLPEEIYQSSGWSIVKSLGHKNESTGSPFVDGSYSCAQNYTIEVLSIDPLVIYLNDFLQGVEIDHLVAASKDEFHASWVFDKNTNQPVISERRSSTSARIPPTDPVSQCLFERMRSLLGNMQHQDIEPLQVVKYEVGQRFAGHMDWFDAPKNMTTSDGNVTRPYNRLATIFAYLEDDCVGGETYFPRIKGVSASADQDKYTNTNTKTGLVVKPWKGNAIFWNNLHPNGTGDKRLLHGGATVTSGTKIGLNMFSMGYLDAPLIGGGHESS